MPCPNCRCPSCLALVGSAIPSPEFSLPSSELMTVNRAPTNSEVAYSRDVIRSSENMVSLIRTMVDDLEKRKTELLDLVSKHKAAISSLRSFPPELLAEIFMHMVHAHPVLKRSPPLKLMGICSQWRRVVLDTPRLWTRILTVHPMIDSWITRSKELPLRLELELSPASYPALEALVPHSHRWQYIHFHLKRGSHSILARVRNRLHSLKRLNLVFDHTIETVDFCEVAPQLTDVVLSGMRRHIIVKLPWEQLRIGTVDNGEAAHHVLQHAENLRGLHLDMSDISWAEPPRLKMPIGFHTLHLKLNILTVEWSSEDPNINSFFSSITLPSLRTLDVHFDHQDIDRPELAYIMIRFFKRSCTHLRSLKLTKIPFPQGVLNECLAYSQSLVSLDIGFDGIWNVLGKQLLDKLNLDHDHPGYVFPHLRSLAFRGQADALIEGPMDALIASRRYIDPECDGITMLENLTLECKFDLIEDPPRLHQFASEGLNITYGKDWQR